MNQSKFGLLTTVCFFSSEQNCFPALGFLIFIMISTTTKTSTLTLSGVQDGRMKVDGTDPKFGDWRDDLARDGYAVIKGAIPRERAEKYADRMMSWLEGL